MAARLCAAGERNIHRSNYEQGYGRMPKDTSLSVFARADVQALPELKQTEKLLTAPVSNF